MTATTVASSQHFVSGLVHDDSQFGRVQVAGKYSVFPVLHDNQAWQMRRGFWASNSAWRSVDRPTEELDLLARIEKAPMESKDRCELVWKILAGSPSGPIDEELKKKESASA